VGYARITDATGGSNSPLGDLTIFSDKSDDDRLFISAYTGSSVFEQLNANAYLSTGDGMSLHFEIPILGW